jgi:glycosyltransferase involved in cell wall biosynthesis
MQENPLVSVIMNCYNGAEFLCDAVDSVMNQTYANWEIVFWDNCSTDQTYEIIGSYTDRRIRYFRGEETVPLGYARNYAIERAQGEFISFLDVDDVWENIKLSEEIKTFANHPQVGLVFSRYVIFSGNTTSFSNSLRTDRYVSVNDLLKNYTIGISAATVRSDIINKKNITFNINFSLIEDYDFFLRIACHTIVYYIGTVLMRYRQHGNNLSKSSDKWMQEFNILIETIKIDKNSYPLLQAQLKKIKNVSMMHNIYSLIIRGKRLQILKQIAGNMYLFPKTWKYLFYILFGYKFYSIMKEKIYKVFRKK